MLAILVEIDVSKLLLSVLTSVLLALAAYDAGYKRAEADLAEEEG